MEVRKVVVISLLAAVAAAGSIFVSFPAGIARAYPIQHAVNVVAAVLLGPVPSVIVAGIAALVRLLTGTGSLLAFPGGMIGAFLAGWLYKKTDQIRYAVVGEIIGTGFLASWFAVPYAAILMGTSVGAFYFMPAFLISSVSGALIGAIVTARLTQINTIRQIHKVFY